MKSGWYCGPVLWVAVAAHAAAPHEHGVARLDLAVEPSRVTLFLELPLDSLLGFERAPRDEGERKRADEARARLGDAAALFAFDPAAHCAPTKVDLNAPALGGAWARDEHADLEATFEFTCRDASRVGFVEVGLFDAFSRLQRLDVQAATRKGQMKLTLKRPARRIALVR